MRHILLTTTFLAEFNRENTEYRMQNSQNNPQNNG